MHILREASALCWPFRLFRVGFLSKPVTQGTPELLSAYFGTAMFLSQIWKTAGSLTLREHRSRRRVTMCTAMTVVTTF